MNVHPVASSYDEIERRHQNSLALANQCKNRNVRDPETETVSSRSGLREPNKVLKERAFGLEQKGQFL